MAVRTIGTDIKLTGEKEFNAGMKAINSNLKTLRSDMALTSAEFADNADSIEALTVKQKILRDSVDQHREKVNALRQMYEKQVAAYGENSHGADKYAGAEQCKCCPDQRRIGPHENHCRVGKDKVGVRERGEVKRRDC